MRASERLKLNVTQSTVTARLKGLEDELGQRFFSKLYTECPELALSTWPGEQADLDKWLGTGLVDAALTYQPTAHENQTIHQLAAENLVLYTTRKGSPMRFDPLYVYVDAGDDFGRRHAEEQMLTRPSSLSEAQSGRLNTFSNMAAQPICLNGWQSPFAPLASCTKCLRLQVFARNTYYLIINDAAPTDWAWLPGVLAEITL